MLTPVYHIGAIAEPDVTEGGVPVVARTAEHCIFAIDFLGEKHTVAVKRKECVFTLHECLEVVGIADADCRAMITVAPCNPETVVDTGHTGVIFVVALFVALEMNRFVLNIPMHTVGTVSGKYIHLHGTVVTTENSGISITERHYGAVEYTVGGRYGIAVDDGVVALAPHYFIAACRTVLPGEIVVLFHFSFLFSLIQYY